MLNIYQSRWSYQNLCHTISNEELTYIQQLTQNYQYPPLIIEKMSQNKDDFFAAALLILDNLNSDIFTLSNLLWGGGSLLSTEADNYRLSLDIDFIANENDYDLFYEWMLDHNPQDLFNPKSKISTGNVRRDRIGIRFPVVSEDTTIKFEIIAEERFTLDIPKATPNQIPKLTKDDRIVSKLFANRDRWIDPSSYCRDLIDLAVLRTQNFVSSNLFSLRANAITKLKNP